MTNILKQTYIDCASGLNMGDFTKVKTGKARTELINKISDMYCEATDSGDETVRSQTISALLLLFWGELLKMQTKCKGVAGLDYEDFAAKLYECINVAMTYRAWKTGKHSAEQCIRQTIASRGAAAILYESNLDQNKANVNNYSLDAVVADDSDMTLGDMIEDTASSNFKDDLSAASMVQTVLNNGDLVGGIILDNIAFSDSQKEVKERKTGVKQIKTNAGENKEKEYKYSVSHSEFSERVLVKTLSDLPENYKNYFVSKYQVNENAIEAAINRIKTVDNNKLYKLVRATLANSKYLAAN